MTDKWDCWYAGLAAARRALKEARDKAEQDELADVVPIAAALHEARERKTRGETEATEADDEQF